MTLKEIFEKNNFIKYRDKELDVSDKKYFLERLKTGKRIYDVLPYLSVVEKVPIDFLEPIIVEAMKYEDISLPKRWMETINRLYTPEKVQEIILNKITSSQSFRVKCRAVSILYSVGGFVSMQGRDSMGKIKWKGGVDYRWNGKRYEKIFLKEYLTQGLKRRKKFYHQRIKILTTEFKKSDNIVFKYLLRMYLPKDIEEYPNEIREIAKDVVHEIYNSNFPNWVNPLIERVKGNPELEKLLFEDLNWQRK